MVFILKTLKKALFRKRAHENNKKGPLPGMPRLGAHKLDIPNHFLYISIGFLSKTIYFEGLCLESFFPNPSIFIDFSITNGPTTI